MRNEALSRILETSRIGMNGKDFLRVTITALVLVFLHFLFKTDSEMFFC